jgi:hypothetical protein
MADFSLHLNDDHKALQSWIHDFTADVIRPDAHIIHGFRELLPDNPRIFQRTLVTFDALWEPKRAEGPPAPQATLMLWSILRTRWPEAAITISGDPGLLDGTSTPTDGIAAWLRNPEAQRLINWPLGGPIGPEEVQRCSSEV